MPIAQLMWPYIERNIDRLVALFEQSDNAARQWKPPAPGSNSLASLVNHAIANAEDNLVGTVVGREVTYDRQIDFDTPDLNATTVRRRWQSVRDRFVGGLPTLTDDLLLQPTPHPRRGTITRFETMLVVARHTAEHLAHAELTHDLYAASTQHDA